MQVDFEKGGVKALDATGKTLLMKSGDPVAAEALKIREALQRHFSPDHGFDQVTRINYFDGIKISFANRDVGHIRPSGNAPQLRFYSNADSQERADGIVQVAIAETDGILRQMEKELDTIV